MKPKNFPFKEEIPDVETLKERTTSDYMSEETVQLIEEAIPDLVMHNKVIEAVDNEIWEYYESSCRECDLRRKYSM